jgi:SanA protein
MQMKYYARTVVLAIEFLVLFVVTTNIIVYFSARPFLYENSASAPTAEAVLIPGAALVLGKTPAPILADRIDLAISLYKEGKARKFLVSGDNSTVEHNEVDRVRNYLLEKGIPDEDIFLDHAGFDTYSSMYRAREIFEAKSILVATQAFHLPRAVFIARQLGMEAYGVNADRGHILFTNYIREVFANEKAIFDLAFNRQPKFLGDQIPISGDGTLYRERLDK